MNGLQKLAQRLRERGLVKVAAQVAGTAVGGPAAGTVLGQVAGSLGARTTDPDELAQAVQFAPEADLLALRQLELEEKKVEAEAFKTEVADMQNARTVHHGHWMTWALPLIIAGMWCAWRAALVFADMSAMTPEAVADTSGVLNNLLVLAFGYWLGSSRGSDNKQVDISGLLKR